MVKYLDSNSLGKRQLSHALVVTFASMVSGATVACWVMPGQRPPRYGTEHTGLGLHGSASWWPWLRHARCTRNALPNMLPSMSPSVSVAAAMRER